MSQDITLKLKINLPTITILVVLLHIIAFFISIPKMNPKLSENSSERVSTPFKIKDMRTVGNKESLRKDTAYVFKGKEDDKVAKTQPDVKEALSLKDLSEQINRAQTQKEQKNQKVSQNNAPQSQRPGSKPKVSKTALEAIKLSGQQMKNYASNAPTQQAFKADPRAAGLNTSDISVNLEVPEGVSPDELNKYELMFYGFQRRTAISYINSFYKNLDKFRRSNPHLEFPMTKDMQVMTGRLTYDEKGNIKKIKMAQWSNIDKLQDFFVEVLKDMDTLHNPPQALWEKDGEFSIYFSLIING